MFSQLSHRIHNPLVVSIFIYPSLSLSLETYPLVAFSVEAPTNPPNLRLSSNQSIEDVKSPYPCEKKKIYIYIFFLFIYLFINTLFESFCSILFLTEKIYSTKQITKILFIDMIVFYAYY